MVDPARIVEGLDNKVKLTMRKSYGFRTAETIEIALYHNLGSLPEPSRSQFLDPNVLETKLEFVIGVELQANHTFRAHLCFRCSSSSNTPEPS